MFLILEVGVFFSVHPILYTPKFYTRNPQHCLQVEHVCLRFIMSSLVAGCCWPELPPALSLSLCAGQASAPLTR